MSEIPPPTVPPATPPPPGGGSYTPPPPPPPAGGGYTGGPVPSGGSDRTLMIVLSYLWLLALIPFLTKKEDPEVQWHAKNGLALLGAEIVIWIVLTIAGFAMRNMALGCGLATINCVIWIAFLILHILCIVKGVGGQRFRIPVVTDMAEKM
jgi:uncharacterized membrane protein